MNALLWTLQVLLAGVFAASGAAKISQPKGRLIASGQTGVASFPLPVIRAVSHSGRRSRLRNCHGGRHRITRLPPRTS
jgi:hypothetical protein